MVVGEQTFTHGRSVERDGARFRLWAPALSHVSVAIEGLKQALPMRAERRGFFQAFVEEVGLGRRYRFELPDGALVPDPA